MFINNVHKIMQEESQKCRVEAHLVGFLNIGKKPGEHSGPFAIWMFLDGDGGGGDDG